MDRVGEQASRMFLEPQVGLLCVPYRVEGPGGQHGQDYSPSSQVTSSLEESHVRERPSLEC